MTSPIREEADRRRVSLETRIRSRYVELPESERRVADVILDFPGQLAAYSATELAGLAGVSKAAASRLFKRLGFGSFEEARRLVRDARSWGSPLYLHQEEPAAQDPGQDLQEAVDSHCAALRRSLERVDPGQLEAAVDALLDAPRVWVAGFRNSHFIASYTRAQLIQLRRNVMLLPSAGETLGEYVAEFEAGQLLLAVGLRRRVPQFRRLLQAARGEGLRVINITDPSAAGSRMVCDWNFVCELDSGHLFDTYVGPMALIHHMCLLAMRRAGKAGRQRLERIEIQHELLSEFE